MNPLRCVTLTERRPAVRRVPRADAADLATRFSHVVDIQPTVRRGVYRLTARGYAGWFDTPTVRWVVRPKLPWADLSRLVAGRDAQPGGFSSAGAGPLPFPGEFADLLAARLADLMRERAAAGLLHGYRERAVDSAEVRGRIDFAEHARRYPPGGLFPVVTDEFTPDVAWNRVPAAAARVLLVSPDLSPAARDDLNRAAAAFADVDDGPPSAAEWDRLAFDARSEPYRRLIGWCRLVFGATGGHSGGLLLNLEHLFQTHVGAVLNSPQVQAQVGLTLEPVRGSATPVTLRPDFLVAGPDGRPQAVWDAKWKPLTAAGPHPADAQQVLAYAAALGVRAAGLVYPGRTSAVREYRTPAGLRLVAVRLRLAGPADRCERSADRFRRLVIS